MNDAQNAVTPRAWVGCLACYNAGRLVGEWFDGAEAGEVTPKDVHEGRWECTCPRSATLTTHDPECPVPSEGANHEELWVFDHEGYGGLIPGECSPAEAQRVAELLADPRVAGLSRAFGAFVECYGRDEDKEGLLDAFEDAYCGEWASVSEYAEELAAGIGAIDPEAGWPLAYIDWDRAGRELISGGDFWTADTPDNGVYVFRTV